MFRRRHLLVYLSEHEASLHLHGPAGWRAVGRFSDSDPASAWSDAVGRDTPLSVVADLIELDMRVDTVPPARGAARTALLQRKLVQTFRQTPYRALLDVRRDSGDGPHQLRVLLGALLNPERVDLWLGPLVSRGVPLAAITAVPNLVAPAAARLRPDSQRLLVVTIEPRAGIRLTYVRDGVLQFSRLGPMPEAREDLPHAVIEETVRTDQYLTSLHLHEARDGPLDVLVLVPPALRSLPWASEVSRTGTLLVTLDDQSRLLPAAAQAEVAGADGFEPVALRLALASGPQHVYGAGDVRLNHRLFMARQWLKGISVAVPLLAGVGVASHVMGALEADREAAEFAQRERVATTEYQRLRRQFPDLNYSADQVRQAVALADEAAASGADGETILRVVSGGLDAVPEARLLRLSWFSPQLDAQRAASVGVAVPSAEEQAAARSAGNPPLPPGLPRWVAVIEGRIDTRAGYREANRLARALASALERSGADPARLGGQAMQVQVQVLQLPFDETASTEVRAEARGSERLPVRIRLDFVPSAGGTR